MSERTDVESVLDAPPSIYPHNGMASSYAIRATRQPASPAADTR